MLTIQITIHTDSGNPLTAFEKRLVAMVAENPEGATAATPVPEVKKTPAKAVEAPKAKAATPVTPEPEKTVEAAPAEPEDSDDEVTVPEETTEVVYTREAATALASSFVAKNKVKVVKAELAKFGKARVSELDDKQVGPFIDALTALDV